MKKIPLVFWILLSSFFIHAQKKYTLEDVYRKGIFAPQSVAGFKSTQDGQHYTKSHLNSSGEINQISKHSFTDPQFEEILMTTTNIDIGEIDHYELSPKEDMIILYTEPDHIYRHSTAYRIYLFDIQNQKLLKSPEDKILHAELSPDEKSLCFVRDQNLYLYDLSTQEEIAITQDGEKNKIINGNCDWVYEEEFGFTQAYQWSPTSRYIAYYRFDESEVKEVTIQYFRELYPENYTFKYPKAGDDNSKISLWLYDTQNQQKKEISIPIKKEYYIPRIYWSPNEWLLVMTLNRLQNHKKIFKYIPQNNAINQIYTEQDDRYVEVGIEPLYIEKDQMVMCSEKDGYNHIYCISLNDGKEKQLTKGAWEVRQVKGISKDKKYIYFTSTKDGVLNNHCYKLKIKNRKIQKITNESGWHDVSFSTSMDYFLDEYSDTSTPPTFILKKNDGSTIRTLEDNQLFLANYKSYTNSTPQLTQIPASGELLNAAIYKPTDFDPSNKYPVLMYQYSGPGSQLVKNTFFMSNHFLHQILLQRGYIIVIADGRGTGARGTEFKKQTYRQLGKLESDDQIEVAKWLQKQRFIDPSRIGIWGWSYGGYMSSICIMKGAYIFSTAIAVAPVTNWRFYDNIYTERYMGLPQDNSDGYDDNSPTTMTHLLKGNFLIVHGLADDNVHFQNTAILIDQMIKANKKFDSEIYPNQAHGMGSGRYHLFERIIDYTTTNL